MLPKSSTDSQQTEADNVKSTENVGSEDVKIEDSSTSEGRTEESTTSKDAKEPEDLADAVRDALKQGPSDKAQSSSPNEEDGEEEAATEEGTAEEKKAEPDAEAAELSEPTEDELKTYKPKTRKRMEWYQNEVKARDQKITDMQPEVDSYAKVRTFCDDAGLTKDDVNLGFNIMRDMRTNPQKALETLVPIMNGLMVQTGETLPDDLRTQVDRGEITKEAAQELSKGRSTIQITEQQRNDDKQRHEQSEVQRGQDDLVALADTCGKAVSDWESTWKKADPDYSKKVHRVQERIELELLRRGQSGTLPKNREEAVKMAQTVLEGINKDLKTSQPKPREHVVVNGVGVNQGSVPEPKTSGEAILQAIGRA